MLVPPLELLLPLEELLAVPDEPLDDEPEELPDEEVGEQPTAELLVQISPPLTTATRWVPVESDATDAH